MVRIRRSLRQPVSWIAGVWVLAGVELVLVLYLVRASPAVSRAPLTLAPEYGEMVVELARTTILVNLMVLLGLWLWVRGPAGEDPQTRVWRLRGTAAAAALVLVSLTMLSLGRNALHTGVQVDAVWQPSDSVVGTVYLSPPLPPIPPIPPQ
jgi:hypothetical protein